MHIIKIILISFFCFFSIFKTHSSDDLSMIKKLLEGRYELISWRQEGITYKYPKVSGTLVVQNDKVSFTLDNNMQIAKQSKVIGWGYYNISKDIYNYRYFDFKKMVIENEKVKIYNDLPWKGMRKYDVYLKDNLLILKTNNGDQTWTLDEKSLVYTDKSWGKNNQQVVRVWKRIN